MATVGVKGLSLIAALSGLALMSELYVSRSQTQRSGYKGSIKEFIPFKIRTAFTAKWITIIYFSD